MIPDAYFERFDTPKYRTKSSVQRELIRRFVARLHTLFLDSEDDVIELSHRARSRDCFARGAIIAAKRLEGRTGVFTFEALILGN